MKKIVISGIVAIAASALIGCETAPTNTNVKVNGNTIANNTAVVTNSNANLGTNTVTNRELTRADFDRDKARYESEVKETGSKVGTGANDLWLWTKTRSALLATDDLRESTINVDVDNAVVTLRGTVGSAAQKTAAEAAAKGIEGVASVKNELKVDANDSMTNQATSGGNANTKTNTNK
jgi:hyperosmotically inducible periplasmic protein